MTNPNATQSAPTGMWMAAVLLFLGSIGIGLLVPWFGLFLALVLLSGGILTYRRTRGTPAHLMVISALAAGACVFLFWLVIFLLFMPVSSSWL